MYIHTAFDADGAAVSRGARTGAAARAPVVRVPAPSTLCVCVAVMVKYKSDETLLAGAWGRAGGAAEAAWGRAAGGQPLLDHPVHLKPSSV